MKLKLVFIAILLTFLSSGWSCIQTAGVAPKAEVEILKQELTRDEAGNVAVLVTIQNVGSFNAELAEVRVSFYDVQKDLIYSARDSILNLKPDEVWNFVLECQGERCSVVDSYDIEVMTGTSSGGF